MNPVELITGLEMFDEALKRSISSHMKRIDEKVFVAGNMKDPDGNDVYIDLSDTMIVTKDKDGNSSDKWIPYTDYYNVEPPKEKRTKEPKTPYDPAKIYLNDRHCILTIPVELLEKMGKPLLTRPPHSLQRTYSVSCRLSNTRTGYVSSSFRM